MLKDKPGKVECKFHSNVILYYKDRMLFHLGYWYDGNGQIRVIMCSKAHPWVKALFARCGGFVPPPLNDMDVLAHIPNRQKENVAMETLNPSVEGKFVSTFQMEGAQNFTPLTNSIEGPNKSTNNTRTFQ
jgi:hypothetical protein